MEGPGGYQLVGRTLQMWNRDRATAEFGQPWLLRFFDQIRFYEVSAEELLAIRAGFPLGRYPLRIEPTTFSLREHHAFLATEAASIAAFDARRQRAFEAELDYWRASGQLAYEEAAPAPAADAGAHSLPPDWEAVESQVAGTVWQWLVTPGQRVTAGDTLAVLEAMKMEIPLTAPFSGIVRSLVRAEGAPVAAGQELLVMQAQSA